MVAQSRRRGDEERLVNVGALLGVVTAAALIVPFFYVQIVAAHAHLGWIRGLHRIRSQPQVESGEMGRWLGGDGERLAVLAGREGEEESAGGDHAAVKAPFPGIGGIRERPASQVHLGAARVVELKPIG